MTRCIFMDCESALFSLTVSVSLMYAFRGSHQNPVEFFWSEKRGKTVFHISWKLPFPVTSFHKLCLKSCCCKKCPFKIAHIEHTSYFMLVMIILIKIKVQNNMKCFQEIPYFWFIDLVLSKSEPTPLSTREGVELGRMSSLQWWILSWNEAFFDIDEEKKCWRTELLQSKTVM